MTKATSYAWTLHYLDDDGNRIGVLFDDDLDRGLDRLVRSPATWIDVHGPGKHRRIYVRDSGPGSDWVLRESPS